MTTTNTKAATFAATLLTFSSLVGGVNAAVNVVPSLTEPTVALDFDAFAVGVTDLAAINATFPRAGILSIVFAEDVGTGTYDTDLGGGNGLVPDGSGGLSIVAEGGIFIPAVSLTVTLDRKITQFGFALADRADSSLELFDEGVSVEFLASTPEPDGFTDFFISDSAFDSFTISQSVNWVIPEIVLEAVPEPSSALLLGLAAIGLTARRKRTA